MLPEDNRSKQLGNTLSRSLYTESTSCLFVIWDTAIVKISLVPILYEVIQIISPTVRTVWVLPYTLDNRAET